MTAKLGGLIDAWTLMPNSDQEEIREISASLANCLDDLIAQPRMGDGDYSCASCGLGMREPCKHWKHWKKDLEAAAPSTPAPPDESAAIQQLEKIAKAISQLEGLSVPYRLALKLSDVMREIQTACEPGGSLNEKR